MRPFNAHTDRVGNTRLLVVLLGVTAGTPLPAASQNRVMVVEPATALAQLASGDRELINTASVVIRAAFRENLREYSNEQRRVLLDEVERIARGETQADELGTISALTTAFSILNGIATDTVSVPEDREIPGRVMRIYAETGRRDSKGLSVSVLGEMLPHYPAERAGIEELLITVASAPPTPDRVPPQTAIDALVNAGEPGVPALRRLHEERSIKEPGAAVYLRELAKTGYRRRDRG